MRGRTADSEAATPVACPQNGAKKVRRGWPAGGQRRTAEAKTDSFVNPLFHFYSHSEYGVAVS